MRAYRQPIRSYLVCPRLLELDRRHGDHPTTWPACRRGKKCWQKHEHETELLDLEGHSVIDLIVPAGGDEWSPLEVHRCACGQHLVHADLDDPHLPENLVELGQVGPGLADPAGL